MLEDGCAKTLFLVTGTSTAGKSTLAEMLLMALAPKPIYPLAHTTCRPPRSDDDVRLIRTISRDQYANERFISCHGDYGVLAADVAAFRRDPMSQIGVAIVSSLDLPTLSTTLASDAAVKTVGVLVTCTGSLDEERAALKKRLSIYFQGTQAQARLALNLELAENFYFDENYRKQFVHTWVHQGMGSPSEWVKRISFSTHTAVDNNLDLSRIERSLLIGRHRINHPSTLLISRP